MTWARAEKVATALLYEGYLLYPYRASALKNQYRWQFGVLTPRAHSEAVGGEPWYMQTEILFESGPAPVLDLEIRFLQLQTRRLEQNAESLAEHAVPRQLVLRGLALTETFGQRVYPFEIEGGEAIEVMPDGDPRVLRERWPLSCAVIVTVEPCAAYRKLGIRIENLTPWPSAVQPSRREALRRSLISAHTLLQIRDAAFVSMFEPPAAAAEYVAGCHNLHAYPVLAGEPPARDVVLSSPIILYDYPEVAPESPGDLFDATEIDELLNLRLLTLTEAERAEARLTDPRARQMIERADLLPPEIFARLHGVTRFARPMEPATERAGLEALLNSPTTPEQDSVEVSGGRVRKGSRVRLRPARRADAIDMFVAGQAATVAGVFRDLEDRAQIAVTIDAAGAADLQEWYGRYFYFGPEEMEVLEDSSEIPPPSESPTVLVAGIGNVFLGDDGFGCAVIERLRTRGLPATVKLKDFGIRGVHLAFELLETGYDMTIIVDALPRGGASGTVYLMEPEIEEGMPVVQDAHSMSVETVLTLLKRMGGTPGRVVIVGCEPASLAPGMELSRSVADAVEEAAITITNLLALPAR